jgi:hypothetical protein
MAAILFAFIRRYLLWAMRRAPTDLLQFHLPYDEHEREVPVPGGRRLSLVRWAACLIC